jgi:hypothetical protein
VTQAPQLAFAPASGFSLSAVFDGLVQWWRRLKGPKPVKPPSPLDRTVDPAAVKANLDERQRRSLWWLTDVPMFFDERSVQRLYDAIVAPEYVLLQATEGAEKGKTDTVAVGSEVGGEFAVPTFFKVNLKAKLDGTYADSAKRTSQVTRQFVYNGQQRLQDVVVAYNQAFKDRVLFLDSEKDELVSLDGSTDWTSAEALLEKAGPRPLVFLDLKPGAPILPMAGETCKGAVVLLYKELERRWWEGGSAMPKYPSDRTASGAARKAYWDALVAAYDSRTALEVVEEGFKAGDRIDWIDYRLKLSASDIPLHLHLAANGEFPTGTFAYNLVRRGHKVGLRLVGLLKAGGDINVLAIYER